MAIDRVFQYSYKNYTIFSEYSREFRPFSYSDYCNKVALVLTILILRSQGLTKAISSLDPTNIMLSCNYITYVG